MRTILWLTLLFQRALCEGYVETEEELDAWRWKHLSRERHNGSDEHLQGCAKACQYLHRSLQFDVTFANTTAYDLEKADYWSTFQSDVSPACFVEPNCTDHVAQIVRVARRTRCKFAVKSGGHAAFTGASNIPGGMTILLKRLNELTLSEDRKITRVGTGNVWIDVYDYLTPRNLSVVGGRGIYQPTSPLFNHPTNISPPVTAIGTGGLTLGGGISFFSGRYGWACDNIRNYELVTASSSILQVNRSSHPSLYYALRGGGNNFGIVTRLDMETFPQGPIWGGSTTTSSTTFPALFKALYHYAHRAPEDPDAALYTAFVYVATEDAYIASTYLTQARGVRDAAVFANFTALPAQASTLRLSNMTDLARELNRSNPDGLRETYQTATFVLRSDAHHAVLADVYDVFHHEVRAIADVAGIVPVLLYQPLTTNVMQRFEREGGNALGMRADEGPLLLVSLAVWWTDAARDEEVLGAVRRIVERAGERAEGIGARHRYIYQNYAAAWQGVFRGYGEENLERLREISQKWDPEGVFSRKDGLQPGYFKLWD